MIFVEFLRYLLGYINFRAYGGFADRFLNLCTKEEIPLWNIKNVDGRISASTTVKGYFAIRSPARKAGMKVCITEKKGLIFFLKRNKTRVGILAGAVIAVLLVFILTRFVWSVSVVGNVSLEDDYILSAFENYGVKVGTLISSIDGDEAARSALCDMEELSWAAVNRKGSVLVIEVRERKNAPEMYDSSLPTNLVASEDGLVLSVDILYGTAEVKPGSAVTKGDLLINGIIKHRDNSESAIHADGRVRALTKKKKTFSGTDFSVCTQSCSQTRKLIFFFGFEIPLGKSVPETYFTRHKSFAESGEKLLPLGIITEHGMDFSESDLLPDESLLKKAALFESALYTKELLEYSEVVKTEISENNGENGKIYDFYAECEQEIGTLQEIYVEKLVT